MQKLENLENVFIGTTIEKHHDGSVSNSKISDTYTQSNVRDGRSQMVSENRELKRQVTRLEKEKAELKQNLYEQKGHT